MKGHTLTWDKWPDDPKKVEIVKKTVKDIEELDKFLSEAKEDAKKSHTVAVLENAKGAVLTFGLGRSKSVLDYMETLDPPYFHSKGKGSEEDSIVFFIEGQWTEFPMSY